MAPIPHSAGVAVVVRGVLGATMVLFPVVWFPVWLLGATVPLTAAVGSGVEGAGLTSGGVSGMSSLLHMFVVQHLEEQLISSCPWLVKVVFCILQT